MTESTSRDPARRTPDHPDPGRLLDLVHGLLPEEEQRELLAHLSGCAACEEEFRLVAASRVRLQIAPAPWRRPRAGESAARASRVRTVWFLAAAAAIVAAMLLAPWLRGDPYRSLLKQLPTYQDDVRFRSAVTALDDARLQEGLDAYGEGEWRRAADLLGGVEPDGPFAVLRDLYLGNALAWLGDYREAVDVLEGSAQGSLPDPWGSEARWTLYVALMGAGSPARADSLLDVLAGEPGRVGERARERQIFLQRQ